MPEPLKSTNARPVILHIPVLEGSILETCSNVQQHLPEGCILASVEHGEDDIYPSAELDIQPGDVLRIVVKSGEAHVLKERLVALGQAAADCIDGE
ncbi:hypothetical protein MASR2M48_26440 [Spirochaetota bacterium]